MLPCFFGRQFRLYLILVDGGGEKGGGRGGKRGKKRKFLSCCFLVFSHFALSRLLFPRTFFLGLQWVRCDLVVCLAFSLFFSLFSVLRRSLSFVITPLPGSWLHHAFCCLFTRVVRFATLLSPLRSRLLPRIFEEDRSGGDDFFMCPPQKSSFLGPFVPSSSVLTVPRRYLHEFPMNVQFSRSTTPNS